MFLRNALLIYVYQNRDTKIQTIITFTNEQKFKEFSNASNKRLYLREELDLPEDYFWNTYIELDEDSYFKEIDDEYKLDKELQQADKFTIN
jgi:hypothetical protein